MSVPANPDADKSWNSLDTYDLQYDGNNIILTVNVPVFIKHNYSISGHLSGVHLDKPIKEIYDYLTSVFRLSGVRRLYVSFYNGECDSYGNKIFSDAFYITSFQIEEVKKYQSAAYFDQAYEVSKLIYAKVAQIFL